MKTTVTETIEVHPTSAVMWNMVGRLVRQVVQFIVSVALARILAPKDFGLLAMAGVFTGFAQNYVDLGVGAALVQRSNLTRKHISTGFWLNVMASVVLFLLLATLAVPISLIYEEPRLRPLLLVLSLQFPLSALSVVQVALLTRAMRFREINIVDVLSTTASGILSVWCALVGFGVWSLVVGTLVYPFSRSLIAYLYTKWIPVLRFDRQAFEEIARFSAPLVGSDTLNYWVRNADNFLIGKYCGSTELGFYSRAYAVMMFPISQLTYSVGAVMFPFLSRLQADAASIKRVLLKTHRIIALLAVPVTLGVCVMAEVFVEALLGRKWLPIVPTLRVLTLIGMAQSIGSSVGWVTNSIGRTDVSLRMSIMSAAVSLTAFVVGLPYGGFGVATAYALGYYLIIFPVGWIMAGKIIGLSFAELCRNIVPLLGAGAMMAVSIYAVDQFLAGKVAVVLRLILGGMSGTLVYFVLIWLFSKPIVLEAIDILKQARFGSAEDR